MYPDPIRTLQSSLVSAREEFLDSNENLRKVVVNRRPLSAEAFDDAVLRRRRAQIKLQEVELLLQVALAEWRRAEGVEGSFLDCSNPDQPVSETEMREIVERIERGEVHYVSDVFEGCSDTCPGNCAASFVGDLLSAREAG